MKTLILLVAFRVDFSPLLEGDEAQKLIVQGAENLLDPDSGKVVNANSLEFENWGTFIGFWK